MNQLNILLINNKSKTITKLNNILQAYGTVDQIEFNSITNNHLLNVDLIVLSGSSLLSANSNKSELTDEFELILNSNLPIIGICLGFEVICEAFGNKIIELDEALDDFNLITIDTDFFKDMPEKITVKESHKWGINLVDNQFKILGRSKSGIEIIKHKDKPIYGFQFHPELYLELTGGDDLLKFVIEDLKM